MDPSTLGSVWGIIYYHNLEACLYLLRQWPWIHRVIQYIPTINWWAPISYIHFFVSVFAVPFPDWEWYGKVHLHIFPEHRCLRRVRSPRWLMGERLGL